MDSAGKRAKSQKWTGTRAATAGPCSSCQQDSLAACKHVACNDPGAHGMNRGQSKMNGGKNDEKGSGHGMAKASRHTACRTRPLQADTAGRRSARHRPQRNNGHQMAGLAAKQQLPDDVGRPLAVQCRLMGGVRWCWHSGRRAQTYLTCLYPTYRLGLSLSLPTPLICKTQFSPNLIFLCFFIFISPYFPL